MMKTMKKSRREERIPKVGIPKVGIPKGISGGVGEEIPRGIPDRM